MRRASSFLSVSLLVYYFVASIWRGQAKNEWISPSFTGLPLGPVFVGGPTGCFESQTRGGNMTEVFITLSHRNRISFNLPSSLALKNSETYSEILVTDLPPVKLYSNRSRAPAVAFVLLIRAPFQSAPFITRFVTGVQESTSCGLRVPPSWYQARVHKILDILGFVNSRKGNYANAGKNR